MKKDKQRKRTVVVGVSGSIAAYKAAELVRLFQKDGWDVWVMMTEAAGQYVGPLTFAALTHHPVARGHLDRVDADTYQHLDLAGRADALVIAPCTANVLAKLAHGLADDVVSATALACEVPLIVAPAMNHRMWRHPATRDNVRTLKRRGACILEPEAGELACGEMGAGRLCPLAKIVAAVRRATGGS